MNAVLALHTQTPFIGQHNLKEVATLLKTEMACLQMSASALVH